MGVAWAFQSQVAKWSPQKPPPNIPHGTIFYRGDVYEDTLPGRVLHDTPVAKAYRSKALLWANFAGMVVRIW